MRPWLAAFFVVCLSLTVKIGDKERTRVNDDSLACVKTWICSGPLGGIGGRPWAPYAPHGQAIQKVYKHSRNASNGQW